MEQRNQLELYSAFENADTILLKKYINNLEGMPVISPGDSIMSIEVGSNAVFYHVDKLVYDKKENIHDKLTTVFSSLLSDKNNGLVMLLKGEYDHVDFYIGNVRRNNSDEIVQGKALENAGRTLVDVLKGNFPGTELHRLNFESRNQKGEFVGKSVKTVIESCFSKVNTIASVSGIAALKNQNENESAVYVQGMEKLVDSMRGKEYAVLYIADVMSKDIIESVCSEYEDIYSQLSPFKQSVKILNENTQKTETESFVSGVVKTTNESLAKVVSHGKSHAATKANTIGGSLGGSVGGSLGKIKIFNVGLSFGYNHSEGTIVGENETEGLTTTEGKAKSLTKQNSIANAVTKGTSESLQITYENRAVRTLLERIDEQIKRLRNCEDFGLFDSCVYFLSDKYENALSAASAYRSLIRGENSSVESSAINVWTFNDAKKIESIKEYLERFYHPLFAIGTVTSDSNQSGKEDLSVSPALMVSGRELAYQFSLPKKALSGLPVVQCAEFGRNAMTVDGEYAGDVKIGHIYHMHHKEISEVKLLEQDLTAHTFITGSTGAGKSNAVFQLLTALTDEPEITFMVVEPAKGEYKDVFGTRDSIKVDVYGTNPRYTPLLRINPFRFPKTTHVYEHLDRLVEIFNVCWPMYAAMPAILKAAIENAYITMGWDLENSINKTGIPIYPTFATVAREVKTYLDKSDYSDENKGNYKGSLLTRLESLTNGINGMVFTPDDVKDEDLFDKNVIIDLSRVGSTETKALIMGVLVMKLQEYRSGTSKKNGQLKHVTVLEEAHNLLKRTSSEQSLEGSNLLGKSVEMLANSIAEMRTYGEAFVIADQAPGLLDMSVIRNTNTKIIFRLPDLSDRELVGKAANLTDEQIEELAKLKTGVAAVYQNNWISPVLCQFDRFENDGKEFVKPDQYRKNNTASMEVLDIIMKSDIRERLDEVDYEKQIIDDIVVSDISDSLKVKILDYIVSRKERHTAKQVAELAYQFFDAESLLNEVSNADDIEEWQRKLIEKLQPSVKSFDEDEIIKLLALLVHEHYLSHKSYEPIYCSYMKYINDRRLLM